MIYGVSEAGVRVRAARGGSAVCPHCGGVLTAKCGAIVVHHWAHRKVRDCVYARGMTQWHYDWLVAYEGLGEGWEIEHFFDSAVRFDAYHPERRQAIEFQRVIDPDYVDRKIAVCREAGISLFWLIHPEVFRNFVYTKRCEDAECEAVFSPTRRGRKVLALLEQHYSRANVTFLIDFRDEGQLPRYCADGYSRLSRNAYRECLKGEPHPMAPGVYRIAGMADNYLRKACLFKLVPQRRKYNL